MKRIFLALIVLSFVACSDDEPSIQINNPENYSFTRNGESTVSYSGQTTRLAMGDELSTTLKNLNADVSTALEMFSNQTASGGDANPFSVTALNESTKSIKSKTAASKDFFSSNTAESATIKADFEFWINAQYSEVTPRQNELANPGFAGQIVDGTSVRYINAIGLEYDQAVIKGLIGALVVDQMLNNYLSPGILDEADNRANNDGGIVETDQAYTTMEHKWDEAYGYLFGASANGANPLSDLGADEFLNKYLNRVNNDSDFEGIASELFEAFKLGRAAIVAGDYETRDEQANFIKEKISEIIAIRAVYYLQQAKFGINTTSGQNLGGVFHDLSEGYGFIYSLRFTRQPNSNNPYFSKSEVDDFITQLSVGNGFWDVTAETLDNISEAIADKFDFTVAQAGE